MTSDEHQSGQGKTAGGEAAESPHWFEKPVNVRKIMIGLYAGCAVLLAIDVWIHKHGPFALEHVWGFYGLYGFLACMVAGIVARALRPFVMRREDYYDS